METTYSGPVKNFAFDAIFTKYFYIYFMKALLIFMMATILFSCGNNPAPQINLPVPLHRATDDLRVYEGKYHRHLFDNGLTITCTIVNKSNLINYKDVKLVVKYYSETNTLMATNYYIIYKYLNAGKLLKVRLNGTRFQSLKNLSVDFLDATRY